MYEIFERLLASFGVSTADVCRATGLRESSISNWKKRGGKCGAKTAEAICTYFDISMDYLMTGKETSGANMIEDKVVRELWYIAKDRDLMEALKVYKKLPPEKKKHVVDNIRLLGAE